MKSILIFTLSIMFLSVTTNLLAVTVDEDNQYVIIKTDMYELHWKKAAQMGYMEAFVGDSQNSLITPGGRAFYHSSNYAGGWKDWGALQEFDVVEKGGGKAVVQYKSNDGGSKEYTCVATYWDGVEYIKHEVTVTNTGAGGVTSFESGHDPQFETNSAIDGMKSWADPFPHAAYWIDGNFAAIYGPDAQEAVLSSWGGRNPGRMMLTHDNLGKTLNKGKSQTITYYVAFGEGEEDEAHDLANHVTEEPASQAVDPSGKLGAIWGSIKTMY